MHTNDSGSVAAFELIARELQRAGVDTVFAYTSEDVVKLVAALDAVGVKIYLTRHEHGAVGMADGYARASGKVGVAIVGRGPGLTNCLNSLTLAARAHTPVLLICGAFAPERPVYETGADRLKLIDQDALLDALSVRHRTFADVSAFRVGLPECLGAAGTGPVVVMLTTAALEHRSPAVAFAVPSTAPAPSAPAAAAIAEIVDVLEASFAARKPLILAGRGAVRAGAREQLVRIGDSIGALLGTSLAARSFFRGAPWDIGVLGNFGTPLATGLATEADLILAFGASLNDHTTDAETLLKKARVIQIDADPAALGLRRPVDIGLAADAGMAANAIADELERRGHRTNGWRTPDLAAQLAARFQWKLGPDRTSDDGLDPRRLFVELERSLPANRAVVCDPGVHGYNGARHLSVPSPDAFAYTVDYAAIGTALGVALGMAVARPDRLTVNVVGDAGFTMAIADFETAARYKLPVLFLVGDDGAVGAERDVLQRAGMPDTVARYANPDFVALARATGADAVDVRTLDDIPNLIAHVGRMKGPLLARCRVRTLRDRDVQLEPAEAATAR